jgi:MSHA biogenesis protein MshL
MKEVQARERRQVPGIGDTPVIGSLFGNSGRSTEKSELVILVKPTIIKDYEDWRKDVLATKKRIDSYSRDDGSEAETGKSSSPQAH